MPNSTLWKRCGNNNNDEDSSPKTLNEKKSSIVSEIQTTNFHFVVVVVVAAAAAIVVVVIVVAYLPIHLFIFSFALSSLSPKTRGLNDVFSSDVIEHIRLRSFF